MKRLITTAGCLLCLISGPLSAATYAIPEGDSVVGKLSWVKSRSEDTLLDIARRHSLGANHIQMANPHLDLWLPGEGSRVILTTRLILPAAPRKGIVLNLAEMRLYYYPFNRPGVVEVYPVGIGRESWPTPETVTRITQKTKGPRWYPPRSIRQEAELRGKPLPEFIPPGPENPLGDYALRLALPRYLLHGTNKPAGVGMRVSHGCIRLYPEHIERLFNAVRKGTQVRIINSAYKVGWRGDELLLEVHSPAYAGANAKSLDYEALMKTIRAAGIGDNTQLDLNAVARAVRGANGIPMVIGERLDMTSP
ncbi:L,D-transpeptidase family protein [Marinobacterium jannaschii]|uniref:L,D-transpeptidase family protein n=1 Tax=Marinobacterium jannaschii TaxID=64970 RepID=UPI000688CA09|nr:L,D-transpeptidase family protein [Marinobacterium jannaschii]